MHFLFFENLYCNYNVGAKNYNERIKCDCDILKIDCYYNIPGMI